MKLADWAREVGIGYRAAHRMFQSGKLPCSSQQLPTGTILVFPDESLDDTAEKVSLYARVSSNDQKADLDRQLDRLRDFASAKGLSVKSEIKEVGSGLNGRRPKLLKLLEDKIVSSIVIEHRDRLCRFGFEYIEAALKSSGRKLLVMNEAEQTDDLTQDFVDVVTSLCARIYGKRSSKNRAQKALEATKNAD